MKSKIVSLIVFSILLSCGGGADIGNPDLGVNTRTYQIGGIVRNSEGKVASNVRVILGKYSDDSCTTNFEDTIKKNGFIVVVMKRLFDTTVTDDSGKYKFEQVTGGKCVIVAEKDYSKALLMTTVNYDVDLNLQLSPAVSFTIVPYPALDTTKPHFVKSRIAGTPYMVYADSSGILRYTSVSSGIFDVVLYRNDSSSVVYTGLDLQTSNTVLQVAPTLAPQYFTVQSDLRQWDGRPYVSRYGKWSDSLPNDGTKMYDAYIQFSHPMDTYLTTKAMIAISQDYKMQVKYVDWQGDGLAYLKLCAMDSLGTCDDNLLRSMKIWRITVDTTAASLYGIRMTWPAQLDIQN